MYRFRTAPVIYSFELLIAYNESVREPITRRR